MASVVQHGRRAVPVVAGSAGLLDKDLLSAAMGDASDMSSPLVIMQAEWQRLKKAAAKTRPRSGLVEHEQRQALLAKSKQSVGEWDNSLAAIRTRKLEAKRVRAETEEARRRQVDLEEEQFQAEQRQQQLEKSKRLQFNATDRAKTFQSAVMTAEVLQERANQLGVREKEHEQLKREDARMHQEAVAAARAAALQEQIKRQTTRLTAVQVGEAILEQAAQRRVQRQQEREAILAERTHMEADVQQFLKDEQARKDQVKTTQLRLLTDIETHCAANEQLQHKAEQEQQRADERTRQHAKRTEERAEIRRQEELMRIRARTEARNSIAEGLWQAAKTKEDNTEVLMQKAIEEQDRRAAAQEEAKRSKRAQAMEDIQEHRSIELERRKKLCKQQQEEAAAELRRNEQDVAAYQQAEAAKTAAQRQRSRETQLTYDAQIIEHQQGILRKRRELEDYRKANEQAMRVEARQFEELACLQIEESRRRGVDTTPMVRQFNRMKPSGASAPLSRESQASDSSRAISAARDRLGFNWD